MSFLQSNTVPVCITKKNTEGKSDLVKLIGTAFFISENGFFLTAKHVLEESIEETKDKELDISLVGKGNNGELEESIAIPIEKFAYAPAPFDIAAGLADYHPKVTLKLQPKEIAIWQPVASLAYPSSAATEELGALWVNIRGYKGYVHRTTLPRDMSIGAHPKGIELSFLLGSCASGCPIFSVPDEVLIGIGVGTIRSETVEDQLLETYEDGKEYVEKRSRIEQFGFAHCINELLDWRPDLFDGKSLQEIANPKTTG